jgi:large subunit ribosomal protein L17
MRILAANFIMREHIETTDVRAKEVRRLVEKLITIAKKKRLADFRLLLQRLPKEAASKLYYEIGPKYAERKGGYTRVIKLGRARVRDGAKISRVEFV